MPPILKDRLNLFAEEHSLVPDDLERRLAQCIELASDPILFKELLERCSHQNDYRLIEAFITCCDWKDSMTWLVKTISLLESDLPNSIRDAWGRSIAQHRGDLALSRLTTLSDVAAQALAHHQGDLYLDGLTSLSGTSAQALAHHKGGIELSRLTTLSDVAAQALAQHQGWLDLGRLTSLSDAAAQALAQHQGPLSLDGLTSLSDAAARALADHGDLHLGLTSLSDAAAQAFAQHEGKLNLPKHLSDLVSAYAPQK